MTTNMHFKTKASFQSYVPTREVPRIIEDISVEDVEKRRAPTKHYAYVVYVAWSSGTVSVVHRTYQDFQRLHNQLQEKFNKDHELCAHGKIIPDLQGRVILGRNNVQKVALWRLQLLDEYCKVLSSLPALVSSGPGVVRFFQPTDLDVKASCPNRGRMSSRRKDQPQGASEISTPLPSERYVAVSDYVKNGTDEMTLTEGDSLEVFIRDESGWWLVCKDQLYGWVPYSYLEKVDGCQDAPVSIVANGRAERYMALTEYSAEEEDEVGLQKGQVVEVLEKHMDGWWRVRYANQEGMAPAVNLAKADSRKARRALEKATKPPEPENDDLDPRLSLFETPRADSDSDSDKDDFVDTLDIITMRERVQASLRLKPTDTTGEAETARMSFKKRAIRPPPRKGSVRARKNVIEHAWAQTGEETITEEEDRGVSRTRNSGSDEEDTDPAESRGVIYENIVLGNAVDTHEDESDKHDYYNVSPFNRKLSTKGRPQYESRSAFKAGDAGETDLFEGETVSVLEKTGTGWWLVQSATGVGWVPSHFLKLPTNRPATGPTVEDLKPDVFEETAPRKYTPKLPSKKETMKKSDHIAFKYLQSAQNELDEGSTNGRDKGSPGISSTKPTAISQNTTPSSSPKPLLKPKPGGNPKTPTASPLIGNVHGLSPTNSSHSTHSGSSHSTHSGSSHSTHSGSSHSTHSSSSSASSGSSRLAPAPPPKKASSSALGVTPSECSQRQEKVAEEKPAGRSVKDLKAMFSRS